MVNIVKKFNGLLKKYMWKVISKILILRYLPNIFHLKKVCVELSRVQQRQSLKQQKATFLVLRKKLFSFSLTIICDAKEVSKRLGSWQKDANFSGLSQSVTIKLSCLASERNIKLNSVQLNGTITKQLQLKFSNFVS